MATIDRVKPKPQQTTTTTSSLSSRSASSFQAPPVASLPANGASKTSTSTLAASAAAAELNRGEISVHRPFKQHRALYHVVTGNSVLPFDYPQKWPYLSLPAADPEPDRKEPHRFFSHPNSQHFVPSVDARQEYGSLTQPMTMVSRMFATDYSFDGEARHLQIVAQANQERSWPDAMHNAVKVVALDPVTGDAVETGETSPPVPGFYRPAFPATIHCPDHLVELSVAVAYRPPVIDPKSFGGHMALESLIDDLKKAQNHTLELKVDARAFRAAFLDAEWDHQNLSSLRDGSEDATFNSHAILYQMSLRKLVNKLGCEVDIRVSTRDAFDAKKRVYWSHRGGVNGLYVPPSGTEYIDEHGVYHLAALSGDQISSADGEQLVYQAPPTVYEPEFHQMIHSLDQVADIKKNLEAALSRYKANNVGATAPWYYVFETPPMNSVTRPAGEDGEPTLYGGIKAASLLQYLIMTNWSRIMALCAKMCPNNPARTLAMEGYGGTPERPALWQIPCTVFDVVVREMVNRYQVEKHIICLHDFTVEVRPLRGADAIRVLEQKHVAYTNTVNLYPEKFPEFAAVLHLILEPYRADKSKWVGNPMNRA